MRYSDKYQSLFFRLSIERFFREIKNKRESDQHSLRFYVTPDNNRSIDAMEWEFPERDDGSKPQFHELSCRICVISRVPGFHKFDERNSATQLRKRKFVQIHSA